MGSWRSDVVDTDTGLYAARNARRGAAPAALLAAVIAGTLFGCLSTAAAAPMASSWGAAPRALSGAGSVISPSLPGGLGSRARDRGVSRRALDRSVASQPLSAATGQISGKVTSAVTHAAIGGLEVCAFGGEELPFIRCQTTGAGGEYTISALEPGGYVVEFGGVESKLDYVTQYYNDKSLESEAESVHVGSELVSGINAALQPGGEITGKVTNTGSTALEKIQVCALEAVNKFPERCAITNVTGEYTIVGVAAGEHDVEFAPAFEGEQNYVTQYYKGEESLSKANGVSVSAESVTSGIDAVLSPGGQITGTVTSFSTHAGLPQVEVCASPISAGAGSRCAPTGPTGAYDITSFSSGSYEVRFIPFGGEYLSQYYNEVSSSALASAVLVTAGSTRTEINAALRQAVPANLTVPSISGSPVAGQTLSVAHGSWTNHPTGYLDEWGRCATSEIESCRTVGAGESYTLSARDLGYAIRVRESAANAGGKGQFAFSAPTANVIAVTGPFSGPLVGSAVPPPTNGILSETTSSPSSAEIKALLVGLLAPTGKSAKIGALLKHGGYAVSFKALSSGRLVISWYLVPKGAHLASAKPLLVAVGRLSFTNSGTRKFSIRLTAGGRSMLTHASRLKLTAKGVLTPSGLGAVHATRSFTLKR